MTIDPKADVKKAFDAKDRPAAESAPDMPERIKNDAPKPVLRPGGSWAARAAEVDQSVREQQDAEKAKNDWTSRIKRKSGRGMGMSFRHSAKGED